MRRPLRWLVAIACGALLVDGIYLAQLWPDWNALRAGPIPESRFMQYYRERRGREPALSPLQWQPVPYAAIPRHVVRAVLVAEDSRFFEHRGFDWEAIRAAVLYNWNQGRIARGASTISQQTAKNLFLHPARSFLRKWHELILTVALEVYLPKQRIIEIYLNVAQLGPGIYGVEAAARAYWGRSVRNLGTREAAELAATLPAPLAANPRRRSAFFRRHADKIHARLLSVLR